MLFQLSFRRKLVGKSTFNDVRLNRLFHFVIVIPSITDSFNGHSVFIALRSYGMIIITFVSRRLLVIQKSSCLTKTAEQSISSSSSINCLNGFGVVNCCAVLVLVLARFGLVASPLLLTTLCALTLLFLTLGTHKSNMKQPFSCRMTILSPVCLFSMKLSSSSRIIRFPAWHILSPMPGCS